MKKAIAIIITFLAFLIIFEIFIMKKEKQEEADSIVESVIEKSKFMNENTVADEENMQSEMGFEIGDEVKEQIEHQLLKKREFSEGKIMILGGSLKKEELDRVYEILYKVKKVSNEEMPLSDLEGLVDSYDVEGFNPNFNGAINLMKKYLDFSVRDSSQINNETYILKILFSSPADEAPVSDASEVICTYNTKHNRVSFEQVVQRKPVEVIYNDEKIKVTVLLLQTSLSGSKIIAAVENITDEVLEAKSLNKFSVKCLFNDENSYFIPLSLYSEYDILVPGTEYYVTDTSYSVLEVQDIKINNK